MKTIVYEVITVNPEKNSIYTAIFANMENAMKQYYEVIGWTMCNVFLLENNYKPGEMLDTYKATLLDEPDNDGKIAFAELGNKGVHYEFYVIEKELKE